MKSFKILLFFIIICIQDSIMQESTTEKSHSDCVDTSNTKIVGGYIDKNLTHYKYMASLRRAGEKYFGSGFFCAGTILSKDLILTAAHCLFKEKKVVSPEQLKVVLGTPKRTVEGRHTKIYEIMFVIPHENYNRSTLRNDIGLLKTKREIEMIPNAIEMVNININSLKPDTKILLAGWGRLFEGGPIANELRLVEVKVFEDKVCQNIKGLSIFFNPKEMFCAGYLCGEAAKDSCSGDSGGPAFQDGSQVGIVSWGIGCGRPGFPGVYTRLSNYKNWLEGNSASFLSSKRLFIFLVFLHF